MASVHGLRGAHHSFGVTLHREKGFQQVDCHAGKRSWYASLLEAILTIPLARFTDWLIARDRRRHQAGRLA